VCCLSIATGPVYARAPTTPASVPTRRPDLPLDLMAPVDEAPRAALAARLRTQVVNLRRVRPDTVPWLGSGWHATHDRVVTAWLGMMGWPRENERLEVQAADGRWLPAAVGLMDARIGLAVLDVPGLGGAYGPPPMAAAEEAGAPGRRALVVTHPPRLGPADADTEPDEALVGGLSVLVEILLGGGPEDPQRAYHRLAYGPTLPLGLPVFDVKGEILTLVSLPADQSGLAGYVLPTDALAALFERAEDWWPSPPAPKP
jgi:hypothetical protein